MFVTIARAITERIPANDLQPFNLYLQIKLFRYRNNVTFPFLVSEVPSR